MPSCTAGLFAETNSAAFVVAPTHQQRGDAARRKRNATPTVHIARIGFDAPKSKRWCITRLPSELRGQGRDVLLRVPTEGRTPWFMSGSRKARPTASRLN